MAFDFENGSSPDAAGRTVLDPAVYKDWQIGAAAEQAPPPRRRNHHRKIRRHCWNLGSKSYLSSP